MLKRQVTKKRTFSPLTFSCSTGNITVTKFKTRTIHDTLDFPKRHHQSFRILHLLKKPAYLSTIKGCLMETEFKVLSHLHENESTTQRHISKRTGLSLGSVNLLLKKMVRKGLVKIERLNKRTVRYILTPRGIKKNPV